MVKRDLPIVSPEGSLLEGLAVIDRGGVETALVVEAGVLVGILTDGDVRRALLAGATLESSIEPVMQRRFTSVTASVGRAEALDIMKARRFKQIPVVDGRGALIGLHLLQDLVGPDNRENVALILCGGMGTRLRPITESIPKPMIAVAGRPILERILLHLVSHGFRRVFLAIHYLGEQIEAHFGHGEKFGCQVSYLREERPLGTGGALTLLPPDVQGPMLVMNGDLITQFDAGRMICQHAARGQRGTIGVQTYLHEVPFGVIEEDEGLVVAMREKPAVRFLVNAGIYIIDSDLRHGLEPGKPTTMPSILEDCLLRGERVGSFHVDEEWMDVGRHEELKKARGLG